LPLQALLTAMLGRTVHLRAHEDNEQCLRAVRKGYSASLKHLVRTQRLSLGCLHEYFYGSEEEAGDAAGTTSLDYARSADHKGDIFTKQLPRQLFQTARARLGMRPKTAPAGVARQLGDFHSCLLALAL